MSKKHKQQQQNKKAPADITGGATVRQMKSIPGLMTCLFTHNVPSGGSNAEFQWTGQPINDIWPTVLAFLKWTYDTYKSESQLRLFVNTRTGEWAPWAFPQKANTGMTAHEIVSSDDKEAYERTMEQRKQFSDTEGWYYWGTVHHHCSGGAFQSGTDTANEKDQDGIHITVGKMDSNHYDIHFRCYVGGFRLSSITPLDFWDIGDEMNTVPEKFRGLLPPNTEELLAKHQMGIPAPKDTEFPQEWRDNIIDVRPKHVTTVSHPVNHYGNDHGGGSKFYGRTFIDKSKPNTQWDQKRGAASMIAYLRYAENQIDCKVKTMDDMIKTLEGLDQLLSEEQMNIMALCVECDILPIDLALFLDEQIAMAELAAEQRKMLAEGATEKQQLELKGHQPKSDELGDHNHWYFGH